MRIPWNFFRKGKNASIQPHLFGAVNQNNPLAVKVVETSESLPTGSLDGAHVSIGSTTDVESASGNGTAIAILKNMRTRLTNGISVIDTAIESALGSPSDTETVSGNGSLVSIAKNIRTRISNSLTITNGIMETSLSSLNSAIGSQTDTEQVSSNTSLMGMIKRLRSVNNYSAYSITNTQKLTMVDSTCFLSTSGKASWLVGISGSADVGIVESVSGASATNESQLITVNGNPTGGTFTLSFAGQTTSALAWNASSATVQTALRALSTIGAGNVTVAGSTGGPYTVTFTGSLSASPQALISADASSLTGGTSMTIVVSKTTLGVVPVSEVQVVTLLGTLIGGNFSLSFLGQTTTPLSYNASSASVQAALVALSTIGAGNVTVSGSNGGPYTINFVSGLANAHQPLLLGNPNGLVGAWAGTMNFEGSIDNVTWIALSGHTLGSSSLVTTTSTSGVYHGNLYTLPYFRVRMNPYTSGSATVISYASTVPHSV